MYDKFRLKKCYFIVSLGIKILDNEMGDEVLSPFSFVYGPAFIYLCIISHHCNACESNKKNPIRYPRHFHQKSSDIVNSLLLAYGTSFEVCNIMASLQSHEKVNSITNRHYELLILYNTILQIKQIL